MIATRRMFLRSAVTLLAAPAIVRASSLMAVRALAPNSPYVSLMEAVRGAFDHEFVVRAAISADAWRAYNAGAPVPQITPPQFRRVALPFHKLTDGIPLEQPRTFERMPGT